ncbi:penicillin-binding protein [Chryseobacterium soli]|nr:penicillin-binding protein [Chryseobacterium soli]MDV7698977.1 penicillin-binding protein [Chryseobacterium soli]
MTKQRAHINVNLCESPSIEGLFGYDELMCNEAKCADFGNYLR